MIAQTWLDVGRYLCPLSATSDGLSFDSIPKLSFGDASSHRLTYISGLSPCSLSQYFSRKLHEALCPDEGHWRDLDHTVCVTKACTQRAAQPYQPSVSSFMNQIPMSFIAESESLWNLSTVFQTPANSQHKTEDQYKDQYKQDLHAVCLVPSLLQMDFDVFEIFAFPQRSHRTLTKATGCGVWQDEGSTVPLKRCKWFPLELSECLFYWESWAEFWGRSLAACYSFFSSTYVCLLARVNCCGALGLGEWESTSESLTSDLAGWGGIHWITGVGVQLNVREVAVTAAHRVPVLTARAKMLPCLEVNEGLLSSCQRRILSFLEHCLGERF